MYRLLYLLSAVLILLVFSGPLKAQTYPLIEDELFRNDARTAIDSLYNRNQEGARLILKPWVDRYPEHPVWSLWNAMELWWVVLEDLYDDQYDEEFFHRMKIADYEANQVLRREPDHPDALLIRAVANGYMARQNANRDNWLTGANIGRRAYQAYERLIEVVPDLPDNDFAIGLKKYYAAYMPDKYPVIKAATWFLPDGNRDEGIESLQTALDNGVFARPEAGYFLGYILLNYEGREEEASVIFRDLVENYPDNSYYRRLLIRSLVQMRQYQDGNQAIEDALSHWEEKRPEEQSVLHEELFYWQGRIRIRTGNTDGATESFIRSHEMGFDLPNTKERDFHSISAYYAGRAYEMLNEMDDAERYYRIVLKQDGSDAIKRNAKTRLDQL